MGGSIPRMYVPGMCFEKYVRNMHVRTPSVLVVSGPITGDYIK